MDPKNRHPLAGLLVAQFLGAFNDNAWKLVVFLLSTRVLESSLPAAAREAATEEISAQVSLVFMLPPIVFSSLAAALADRVSKSRSIVVIKGCEIAFLALGALIVAVAPENKSALYAVIVLMAIASAFFAPAKYGILPEILPHEKLSAGNGVLEMWTVLAIIAGSALGPSLFALDETRLWIAPVALAILAVVAFVAALFVPRRPAAQGAGVNGAGAASPGLVRTLTLGFASIRADRVLRRVIAGSAFYWLVASALGAIVIAHAKTRLGLADAYVGLPLAACGAGFALGAVAAGRLSEARVELGLVPLGAGGFALSLIALAAFDPSAIGACAILFFAGVASGFVVVPLNALLQWRAPADQRGAVIGLANIIVYTGMLLGTIAIWIASGAGVSTRGLYLGAGAAMLAGTLWALWILPEAFLRLVLVIATRTIYRLRVDGLENVPREGGALLAPNHVAMVDGLFLMAVIDRPIRFLVDKDEYEKWWQKPFMRALDAIPISSSGGPREILRGLRQAGKHLEDGHIVCIFPEGQLTRTGMMQPFRRGMERIARGRGAPIVPIHLGGVWGSIFSGSRGRFVWKMPERIPYRVSIAFGAPLPDSTLAGEVRRAVIDLGEADWRRKADEREPLHRTFVRVARRRPGRRAVFDATSGALSRIKLLTSAVVLARTFRSRWSTESAVGILLPPSVASTSLNIAASLAGKPSVNLNYTSGRAGMESAAKQAGLKSVITSRAFLEKAKLELPATLDVILLDDVRPTITRWTKMRALLAARYAPIAWLERLCGAVQPPALDDVLTIIFSSGSTGEPKGVPLTHKNLAANVEGVAQVLAVNASDGLLGILPTFHSFGYMALWFALNHGVLLAAHANPLDAAAVGDLVEKKRLTLMICTPTFLTIYMRRCTPAQFGSLRIIMAGAEKMPDRLALAFEDKFGIRPIEGYGTTECSPVVAVSTPTVRKAGIHQAGSKRGSVGQPLPGVSLRIVDPDSFEPLAAGAPGMLLVKGANVMNGYLGRPDLTAQVLRDGWYVTGDIAVLDDEGFLRITDRLSRFSKIGGEMVPHGKVEDALQQAADADMPVFAVTSVPDEKKGERLAVLTTLDEAKLPAVLEKLAKMGLPNLFLPRLDAFVRVESLPLLGTGKLDLKRVKQVALEKLEVKVG